MITVLLWLLFVADDGPRIFHRVTVAGMQTTKWTHVVVCARVTFVKNEADGDVHIKLEDGPAFVVAEIVPYHKVRVPKVGQFARVAGIAREDKTHHWFEIHPVEIMVIGKCTPTK